MDGRKGKIGFIVEEREAVNGVVRLSVRMLNSSLPCSTTNELPMLLNSIMATEHIIPNANDRFTYKFPLPLAQGWGFPYTLDLQFEDENLLTLT